MFNRKVAPGEKAYAETMSSSMISSNPTFNESILPTDNVVIFGDSLVNFNRKIKYNITRSLNMEEKKLKIFLEQPLKICYTTLIQLYEIILLKWQLFIYVSIILLIIEVL